MKLCLCNVLETWMVVICGMFQPEYQYIFWDGGIAVNMVCRRVKEQALQLQEPLRAILPLQAAIRKLQPSSEFLTAMHADFLQMCLLAKCYKASLSVLEDDIFEIDQKRTGLVPRDFLLYCYYGYVHSNLHKQLKTFSINSKVVDSQWHMCHLRSSLALYHETFVLMIPCCAGEWSTLDWSNLARLWSSSSM